MLPSPLAFVLRFWALLACWEWSAHALVSSSHGQQLAPARRRGAGGAAEIAGWTKIIACADQTTPNRMLFTAAEIMSMATNATRVKYCHYGSTTDCVTSVAGSFPIAMLRQGGSTSIRENGVYCYVHCASSLWEDDDPSAGLSLPDAMWASCSTAAGLTGALTGSVMLHQTCNNLYGLVLGVSDTGRCCWKTGDCYQGTDPEAGVEMYIDIAAPAVAPTSFGDPHVSNLRGEKFDILSPGDFVYLSIPRAATAAAGSGALLRIVAKVEPLGRLCQDRLLFVTGLDLSGQWLLGGRVRSLSLSTSVQAKMEAEALRISVLPVPPASLGNGRSGGSETVARDLNASELAAEFGPGAGLLEVTDYMPSALPGAVNQHVAVLLLKLQLGPTIAKIRMVQQREKDEEGPYQEASEESEAGKGKKPRFSNSLWLTVTGLEQILKGEGGAADIGGILGFDDHRSATLPPQECKSMLQMDKQRIEGSAGGGGVHATVSLKHGAPTDDDLI